MSTSWSKPLLKEPVDGETFRTMMAGFPSGVTIVTAIDASGRPLGMTCSSLTSVSLRPPTLLVCVREGSPTLAAIEESGGLTVNLLHAGGRPDAELFSSGAPDRFSRVEWTRHADVGGPHLVQAAHQVADCRVSETKRIGDHVVVFGEVVRVTGYRAEDRRPLLYGMRDYGTWPPAPPIR